jgi:hypothetical protein
MPLATLIPIEDEPQAAGALAPNPAPSPPLTSAAAPAPEAYTPTYMRLGPGLENLVNMGAVDLDAMDPIDRAHLANYWQDQGLTEDGLVKFDNHDQEQWDVDWGEVLGRVGSDLLEGAKRSAPQAMKALGTSLALPFNEDVREETGAFLKELGAAGLSNIEGLKLAFGINSQKSAGPDALPEDVRGALGDWSQTGGSLVGMVAPWNGDDQKKRESYAQYAAFTKLGRREAQRIYKLSEESGVPLEDLRKSNAYLQLFTDPTVIAGGAASGGVKTLLSGTIAAKEGVKALAKGAGAAVAGRVTAKTFRIAQEAPIYSIITGVENANKIRSGVQAGVAGLINNETKLGRFMNKAGRVIQGGPTAAGVTVAGEGLLQTSRALRGISNLAKAQGGKILIGGGSAAAGYMAADGNGRQRLTDAAIWGVAGYATMRHGFLAASLLSEGTGRALQVGGRVLRNRYQTLGLISAEAKILRSGIKPEVVAMASATTGPSFGKALMNLALRQPANLVDNAINGAMINGVLGYATTGTMQGAMEQGATGMIYHNVGYYTGRATVHAARAAAGANLPRGASIGLYSDPLALASDRRLMLDWSETMPDQQSRVALRDAIVKADGAELQSIRGAVDYSLWSGTQIMPVSAKQFGDIAARRALGAKIGSEEAADAIWSQYQQDLEGGKVVQETMTDANGKLWARYKTKQPSYELPDGRTIRARDLHSDALHQSQTGNKGLSHHVIDDVTGEAVPALVLNPEAPGFDWGDIAAHEAWHALFTNTQLRGQRNKILSSLVPPEQIPGAFDKLMADKGQSARWKDMVGPKAKRDAIAWTLDELAGDYFQEFVAPLTRNVQGGVSSAAAQILHAAAGAERTKGGLLNPFRGALAQMRSGLEVLGVKMGLGGLAFDANGNVIGPSYINKGRLVPRMQGKEVRDYGTRAKAEAAVRQIRRDGAPLKPQEYRIIEHEGKVHLAVYEPRQQPMHRDNGIDRMVAEFVLAREKLNEAANHAIYDDRAHDFSVALSEARRSITERVSEIRRDLRNARDPEVQAELTRQLQELERESDRQLKTRLTELERERRRANDPDDRRDVEAEINAIKREKQRRQATRDDVTFFGDILRQIPEAEPVRKPAPGSKSTESQPSPEPMPEDGPPVVEPPDLIYDARDVGETTPAKPDEFLQAIRLNGEVESAGGVANPRAKWAVKETPKGRQYKAQGQYFTERQLEQIDEEHPYLAQRIRDLNGLMKDRFGEELQIVYMPAGDPNDRHGSMISRPAEMYRVLPVGFGIDKKGLIFFKALDADRYYGAMQQLSDHWGEVYSEANPEPKGKPIDIDGATFADAFRDPQEMDFKMQIYLAKLAQGERGEGTLDMPSEAQMARANELGLSEDPFTITAEQRDLLNQFIGISGALDEVGAMTDLEGNVLPSDERGNPNPERQRRWDQFRDFRMERIVGIDNQPGPGSYPISAVPLWINFASPDLRFNPAEFDVPRFAGPDENSPENTGATDRLSGMLPAWQKSPSAPSGQPQSSPNTSSDLPNPMPSKSGPISALRPGINPVAPEAAPLTARFPEPKTARGRGERPPKVPTSLEDALRDAGQTHAEGNFAKPTTPIVVRRLEGSRAKPQRDAELRNYGQVVRVKGAGLEIDPEAAPEYINAAMVNLYPARKVKPVDDLIRVGTETGLHGFTISVPNSRLEGGWDRRQYALRIPDEGGEPRWMYRGSKDPKWENAQKMPATGKDITFRFQDGTEVHVAEPGNSKASREFKLKALALITNEEGLEIETFGKAALDRTRAEYVRRYLYDEEWATDPENADMVAAIEDVLAPSEEPLTQPSEVDLEIEPGMEQDPEADAEVDPDVVYEPMAGPEEPADPPAPTEPPPDMPEPLPPLPPPVPITMRRDGLREVVDGMAKSLLGTTDRASNEPLLVDPMTESKRLFRHFRGKDTLDMGNAAGAFPDQASQDAQNFQRILKAASDLTTQMDAARADAEIELRSKLEQIRPQTFEGEVAFEQRVDDAVQASNYMHNVAMQAVRRATVGPLAELQTSLDAVLPGDLVRAQDAMRKVANYLTDTYRHLRRAEIHLQAAKNDLARQVYADLKRLYERPQYAGIDTRDVLDGLPLKFASAEDPAGIDNAMRRLFKLPPAARSREFPLLGASRDELSTYRDWLKTQPSKGRWIEPEAIDNVLRNDRSMMDPISAEDIDEHLENYGGTREEAERELRLYRGAGVMAMWTRTPGSPRISEVLFSEAGTAAQKMLAARTLKSVLEGWNASGVEPRLQAVQLFNFGFPDAMAEQLSGATLPFNESMPKPPESGGMDRDGLGGLDLPRFASAENIERIEALIRPSSWQGFPAGDSKAEHPKGVVRAFTAAVSDRLLDLVFHRDSTSHVGVQRGWGYYWHADNIGVASKSSTADWEQGMIVPENPPDLTNEAWDDFSHDQAEFDHHVGLHEFGHGVDYSDGYPSHRDMAFQTAWVKDASALRKEGDPVILNALQYFLQVPSEEKRLRHRGRLEAFAEGFAAIHGAKGPRVELFAEKFRNVMEYLRQRYSQDLPNP